MASQDYLKASRYENLIRNAFNCSTGMKNGAHLCFMQNAITMERGETFAKHLGTFDNQFEKVKNYISKALIKLSKTKPYSINSEFFIDFNNEISDVSTTEELMEIVDKSLNKITEFKNQ